MYTVNKTRSRKKIFLSFLTFLVLLFAVVALLLWLFVLRTEDASVTSFEKTGGNVVSVVAPATVTFTNELFEISLPEGWVDQGKKRPNVDSEYYLFKSEVENYDNRWLYVYVDVFPADYALNRVMPIEVDGNRVVPGDISTDCKLFDGAPENPRQGERSWTANYNGIEFTCNIGNDVNHVGTATEEFGYGTPITGTKSGTHDYFFVYVDHNVRKNDFILKEAVESFKAI